jgi:hypothetical protein
MDKGCVRAALASPPERVLAHPLLIVEQLPLPPSKLALIALFLFSPLPSTIDLHLPTFPFFRQTKNPPPQLQERITLGQTEASIPGDHQTDVTSNQACRQSDGELLSQRTQHPVDPTISAISRRTAHEEAQAKANRQSIARQSPPNIALPCDPRDRATP